jgi:type II secretory pathway pseudopilin PulG
MDPRPSSRPRARGFTVVEILIVAVTVGLLAALVVPSVASALGDMNREAALARARQVHTMITRYNQFLPGGGPEISTANGAISQPDLARLVSAGYCDPGDLTNHLTGTPSWSFASGKVVPGP